MSLRDESRARHREESGSNGTDTVTADDGVQEVVEALLDEVRRDAAAARSSRPGTSGAGRHRHGRVERHRPGRRARAGRGVARTSASASWTTGGQARAEAQDMARRSARDRRSRVFFRACDVRESARREALRGRRPTPSLGGLHILVNNAGIGRDRALWHMEDHEWEAVAPDQPGRRLLLHPGRGADHAGAGVREDRERRARCTGVRTDFGISNYAASKAGLIGLTRSAAVELGPRNINVNAVAPGYIRTTRLTARGAVRRPRPGTGAVGAGPARGPPGRRGRGALPVLRGGAPHHGGRDSRGRRLSALVRVADARAPPRFVTCPCDS